MRVPVASPDDQQRVAVQLDEALAVAITTLIAKARQLIARQ